MGERRDEAQPPAGLLDPEVTRGATGPVVGLGQREMPGDLGACQRQRQILVEPGCVADLAHRHDLDQDQVHAAAVAPADHLVELAVVDAAQRHRIDLDREPGALGSVEAAHHLVEIAPARELAEFVGIERVHRHVHPAHADIGQFLGILGELAAVGRQGEFFQRAAVEMFSETAEQRHHVLAHQRLAARQAQLLDAATDEGSAQTLQLLERQHLRLGQEGHVLGHAVDAAKVAAIRHGDAEIGDVAAERVDHGSSVTVTPG